MRAWTDLPDNYPFRADFDDFALHQVESGVPGAPESVAPESQPGT
jgi:hypothetical protein